MTNIMFLTVAAVLLGCVSLSQAQCDGGCLNGATCSGSTCNCTAGWYGKRCHRPCQDVFKSCDRWKEEGRCDWDDQTMYFDDHCPHTCENCVYDNITIVEYPLAPLLEPLLPFLGVWIGESSTPDHFPVDFQSGGYEEEIRIMPTEMPAFDRPSLNYTAKAISKVDSNDIHYDYGFLYVKPGKNVTVVGLMATGNSGITFVQEGHLNGNGVKFTTTFNTTLPAARLDNAHLDSARTLEVVGEFLSVSVLNQQQSYIKYYRRVQEEKPALFYS